MKHTDEVQQPLDHALVQVVQSFIGNILVATAVLQAPEAGGAKMQTSGLKKLVHSGKGGTCLKDSIYHHMLGTY